MAKGANDTAREFFKEQLRKGDYYYKDDNGNIQKYVDDKGHFTEEGEKHATEYANNMVNMARAAGHGNATAIAAMEKINEGDGNGGLALPTYQEAIKYSSKQNK